MVCIFIFGYFYCKIVNCKLKYYKNIMVLLVYSVFELQDIFFFFIDCKFNCYKKCVEYVFKDCIGEFFKIGGKDEYWYIVFLFFYFVKFRNY